MPLFASFYCPRPPRPLASRSSSLSSLPFLVEPRRSPSLASLSPLPFRRTTRPPRSLVVSPRPPSSSSLSSLARSSRTSPVLVGPVVSSPRPFAVLSKNSRRSSSSFLAPLCLVGPSPSLVVSPRPLAFLVEPRRPLRRLLLVLAVLVELPPSSPRTRRLSSSLPFCRTSAVPRRLLVLVVSRSSCAVLVEPRRPDRLNLVPTLFLVVSLGPTLLPRGVLAVPRRPSSVSLLVALRSTSNLAVPRVPPSSLRYVALPFVGRSLAVLSSLVVSPRPLPFLVEGLASLVELAVPVRSLGSVPTCSSSSLVVSASSPARSRRPSPFLVSLRRPSSSLAVPRRPSPSLLVPVVLVRLSSSLAVLCRSVAVPRRFSPRPHLVPRRPTSSLSRPFVPRPSSSIVVSRSSPSRFLVVPRPSSSSPRRSLGRPASLVVVRVQSRPRVQRGRVVPLSPRAVVSGLLCLPRLWIQKALVMT
ncbi:hypothetical protein C7M84_013742 [Penaeus vannamei]|uniref:Uncharacterized protein n=1 Tax=Penaeus vannamei TaxID=6689 RepID=A0A423SVA2_PENVA|nr:hypothetical protein C7M84_013742 [Penaeus vannamei]